MLSNEQFRLFIDTGIPDWLPDETLYSLASRYHKLSGSPPPDITATRLFGGKRRGHQHDLPSGLDHFVTASEFKHGTVEEIAFTRTILPFFLTFKDRDTANDALITMAGAHIGSLKYRLGILTSRLGAIHPLKACPECLEHDLRVHSVGYWRLHHQFPGVWVCPDHHIPLHSSPLKSFGASRFDWLLPAQAELQPWATVSFSLQKSTPLLIDLAKVVIGLASVPPNTYVASTRLLQIFLNTLKERSLLTESGRLRAKEIGKEYFEFYRSFLKTPLATSIPHTAQEASTQICRLLRTPRTGTHPLRHAMLITWLFKHPDTFWKALQRVSSLYTQTTHSSQTKPSECDLPGKRAGFLHLVEEKRISVTQASLQVGIDIATGIGWAAAAGISTTRRSKKLNTELRAQLTALIVKGLDRAEIGKKCNVSVTTVSRFIRSEVGLEQAWIDARFQRRKEEERKKWRKSVNASRQSGIKALRAHEPATFAWLHRNDRAWLKQINTTVPRKPSPNPRPINWLKCDEELADKVRRTALKLAEENGNRPLSQTAICQALPALRVKMAKLDVLPLTQAALKQVTAKKGNSTHNDDNLFLP